MPPPLPPPPGAWANPSGALPPWAPGPPVAAGPVRPVTDGDAVAALVIGVVALVTCPPTGLVAWFLGRRARRRIAASAGARQGDGLAIAGQVLGLVAVGLLAAGVAFVVALLVLGWLFGGTTTPATSV